MKRVLKWINFGGIVCLGKSGTDRDVEVSKKTCGIEWGAVTVWDTLKTIY